MRLITRVKKMVSYTMCMVLVLFCGFASAQKTVMINLAPIDGIDITPDNIFNYQLHSSLPGTKPAVITGTIRYRNSNLSISYSFPFNIRPGVNFVGNEPIHPQWQFSSYALQQLFLNYKTLPEGTYEYCVKVQLNTGTVSDMPGNEVDECLYHRAQDIFLINLIDPENGAKIHEYNPMLSWVVNYPMASELTYRVRVAEIKPGQDPVNAILRNQPVYDESNLMQNSVVYPIYAKPLVKNQPYAWTVDAFFRGLLLGGAETWKFTIIDDSLYNAGGGNNSYIDIKKENGSQVMTAAGDIKLKYFLNNVRIDTLTLSLEDANNNMVNIVPAKLSAVYGDNRYDLDLKDSCSLKDNTKYRLFISSQTGERYTIPFNYENPDFIK